MIKLLKVFAFFWSILGLANIILIPKINNSGGSLKISSEFNGYIFLISALLLVGYAFVLEKKYLKSTSNKQTANGSLNSKNETRLKELKTLRTKRLVSMREYKHKRQEIIKDL